MMSILGVIGAVFVGGPIGGIIYSSFDRSVSIHGGGPILGVLSGWFVGGGVGD